MFIQFVYILRSKGVEIIVLCFTIISTNPIGIFFLSLELETFLRVCITTQTKTQEKKKPKSWETNRNWKLGPNQINTNPRFLEKLIHFILIGTDPGLIIIAVTALRRSIIGRRRRHRGWWRRKSEPVVGIGVVVTEEFGEEEEERGHFDDGEIGRRWIDWKSVGRFYCDEGKKRGN